MRRFFNNDCSVGLVCAKFIVALFLLVVFISSADAREVTLQWDPNSETDLSHYVVHWGTGSRSYTNSSGDIGLDTSYSCTLPDDGEVYYFAVTAVDEAGLESDYSNEVDTGGATGNSSPNAIAGPDQNVNEGASVYLDASNSNDPDGDTISYQWTQTSGISVTFDDPTAIQPSFTAPSISSQGEALTFQLTVTDEEGLQSTDSCIVNVVSVNNPPTADAGPDQNINEGSLVYLDGTNSSDPDGDALTYQWTQTEGPSITFDGSTSTQPTFDSPYISSEGESLTFQLTVTDEYGLQSTDSCVVNIISVNNPPEADAGPDQNINEGSTVYLNGTNSSDPDGDALTYQWTQTDGSAVTLDNPSSVQPSFDSPYIESEGESLTFQLTVTDEGGLQSTDTCIVNIVYVNNPPEASAGPDQTVDEGTLVTLNGSGSSDPDDDALTFKWIQTGGTSVTLSSSIIANPVFESFYVDPEGESLTFQLTVTDEDGLQSTDTCIVNIAWVNDPPVANAGPDQDVDEGSSVTLDGSGSSDPEGNSLTYKWTQISGPAVTFSDSNIANTTFDIPYIDTDGESMTFQLTVTDEGGLQSTDTCIVNIVSVNNPPVANAGSDQTIDEGSVVTLNGSGSSDPDGDELTYKWTQVSGPVVTLNNSGTIQANFESPDVDMVGASAVFQLTVTDEYGLKATDTCTVNISWVNEAPTANAGSDQTVDEGTAATLNGSGSSDPEGNALTYKWTQVSGPAVTLNNSGSAVATFTSPDVNTEGASLVFQLTVTDGGGLESTDSCTVNVSWVNEAPTADAGSDQTVDEGTAVTLDGSGSSDPDNNTLTYKWTQVSGTSVTLNNSGSAVATFTSPDVNTEGASLVFQLTITDEGGLDSTDTCTVNVSWVNEAPTADAGSDQTVDEESAVTLDGSGSSDPDNNTLTYKWTQVSGTSVILNNSGSAVATFTSPDVNTEGASLVFQLTVTDEGGLESTDTCTVNVSWVNEAPTADAGSDQTVDEGTAVTLNGSGSSDPDNNTLTYEWTQVSGPTVVLNNSGSAVATFTSPDVNKEGGSIVFQLTVTDEGGLNATDTCMVNVSWVNEAPTANAGTDQSANEGSIVILNGSGSSDPDGDALSYNWIQVSGPAVTLNNAGSVQATFVSPDVSTGGAYVTFQLTVTDPNGLQSTDRCIVNILFVNETPAANAGSDQTVNEGAVATLDGSGSSDPDGDTLSYSWTQVSGPSVALNNSGSANPTFSAPDVGMEGASIVLQLTVTDEGGLKATDTCVVNVSWVNEAPTASAGADQAVDEGTVVSLDGSGSSDPDGETLSYEWTQISGPDVVLDDTSAVGPVFNAPTDISEDITLVFQLTVTDAGGLKSTDQCSVTIAGSNSVDLTGNWNSLRKYWSWTDRAFVLDGNFSVHNDGSLLNKTFKVSFYLSTDNAYSSDDILIFAQSVASIGANDLVNISLNKIKDSNLAWRNYVVCRIDDDNTINEDNENNNSIASRIYFNFWSYFWR